jgi:L-carnitine CoA-transferase
VSQNKYLLETIGLGDLWGTPDIPEDCSALWLSNPHAKEIEEHLEAYLAAHSKFDVEKDFSEHRIAAQVVKEFPDLVKEEHLKLRDNWMDWQTEDGDTFHGLGVFPKFQQTPGSVWRPMPKHGGDTRDVLQKLGYSEETIDKLIADGVVKAE